MPSMIEMRVFDAGRLQGRDQDVPAAQTAAATAGSVLESQPDR